MHCRKMHKANSGEEHLPGYTPRLNSDSKVMALLQAAEPMTPNNHCQPILRHHVYLRACCCSSHIMKKDVCLDNRTKLCAWAIHAADVVTSKAADAMLYQFHCMHITIIFQKGCMLRSWTIVNNFHGKSRLHDMKPV